MSIIETQGLFILLQNIFNTQNYSAAKKYYFILNNLYPLKSAYPLLLGHIAVKEKDYSSGTSISGALVVELAGHIITDNACQPQRRVRLLWN